MITDEIFGSEFSENIVEYIAGYVSLKLGQTRQCETCIAALIDCDTQKQNLINIKNRDGLTQTSRDVITICYKCEIVIRQAFHIGCGTKINKKYIGQYLSNLVLRNINMNIIFKNLEEHTNEQLALETHVIYLTKAIIQRYIKIHTLYTLYRFASNK